MGIQRIVPTSEWHWHELRSPNVNSTESAALFDLSPYLTKFELWHRKKAQQIVSFEGSERMKWGTRLEAAIALGLAEDEGWKIRKMNRYAFDPELRLGSSFDYEIVSDGCLEIKNVDALQFRDGWLFDDNGNCEAPPHIEIQHQQQLFLGQKQFGYIAALIGGNQIQKIKREPDQKIISAIKSEAAKFWKSIEENEPPRPDYVRDADFICSMFSNAVSNKIIEAKGNSELVKLAGFYRTIGNEIKRLDGDRKAVKAQIIEMIGDAEKVLGESFTISASTVASAFIESYERKSYRDFRINWKKEKPKGAANAGQPEI